MQRAEGALRLSPDRYSRRCRKAARGPRREARRSLPASPARPLRHIAIGPGAPDRWDQTGLAAIGRVCVFGGKGRSWVGSGFEARHRTRRLAITLRGRGPPAQAASHRMMTHPMASTMPPTATISVRCSSLDLSLDSGRPPGEPQEADRRIAPHR